MLWTFLITVVITGAVHALALMLPNMFSGGSARKMSSFEQSTLKFSGYWLDNAVWLAGVVAGLSFIVFLPLFLRRVKAANRRDSDVAATAPPPGHS